MLVLLHFLGHVVFASFLKKKSGACSGRVVFALIFKKESGACSGLM